MLRALGTTIFRPATHRAVSTAIAKKGGDISDSFVSLSGTQQDPLPDRFRKLKCETVRDREACIVAGWQRLLAQLRKENETIAHKGSDVIPEVNFSDLEAEVNHLKSEIKKRGAIVVRGVVPESEARAYKDEVEEYVRRNPWTKAFPPDSPQVYELYWSAPQLKARLHPSLLRVQRCLMSSIWHTSSINAQISLQHPLSYADRLRIRQPGDAKFALGPHMDGGSVERWERNGYGRGNVYDKILEGDWEHFDPWDADGRIQAVNNLYDGLGACTMFRAWQGWLSMSHSGPREGTLLVNPLMQMSTAYLLLRPFFAPLDTKRGPAFLHESNWKLSSEADMTSELHGATPGHGQELTDQLHPHLELDRTMVHMPNVRPGDFVAWHCDTIHSVDKTHRGLGDSSVLYIPICPITEINAAYLVRQREAFRQGTPGPDFPGGEGESRHIGRPTEDAVRSWTNAMGRQAFGLDAIELREGALPGEKNVVRRANAILGL